MSALEIREMKDGFGAEIRGIDLAQLSDSDFEKVLQTFRQQGVVFFRDQSLSIEDHVEFAKRLGPININRFFQPVENYPMVAEVRKEPDQKVNVGGAWHTDHSYDEVPALGSVLVARELPESGGDTLFANLALAYEALSPGFQEMLETLKARHSSRHVFGAQARYSEEVSGRIGNPEKAVQDSLHPVVIRHPDTGRKILYVNPGFTIGIEGWSEPESKALLGFLYHHAQQPQFQVRFDWQPGSVALWDNRTTWHNAVNDYPGQRRLMHRVTIEGTPLR